MYKLIATDMDGTLLNSSSKLSDVNKQYIKEALKSDICFVLASGRPTYGLQGFAKELEFDKYNGYLLAYNGAKVINYKTGYTIYQKTLNKEQIEAIISFSKKYNTTFVTYINNIIHTSMINEYSEIEKKYTDMPICKVEDENALSCEKIYKFMYIDSPERIDEILEDFSKHCDVHNLAIAKSDPHFLEIIDKSVNKGTSLARLCEYLGIDIKDSIAVGDSFNDLPMLSVAGMPIAAGNAHDAIKNVCKYVSVTNDHHILADVIKRFIDFKK